MSSNADIHYFAGIFDSAASIQLDKTPAGHRPVIAITSVDTALIELLHERFGGTTNTRTRSAAHHRVSSTWRIHGRTVVEVLMLIGPSLVISRKRERARLLTEEYLACTPRNGRYTPEMRSQKESLVQRFHACI